MSNLKKNSIARGLLVAENLRTSEKGCGIQLLTITCFCTILSVYVVCHSLFSGICLLAICNNTVSLSLCSSVFMFLLFHTLLVKSGCGLTVRTGSVTSRAGFCEKNATVSDGRSTRFLRSGTGCDCSSRRRGLTSTTSSRSLPKSRDRSDLGCVFGLG